MSICHSRANFDTAIGVFSKASCVNPTCLISNAANSLCSETSSRSSAVLFDSGVGEEYLFHASNQEGHHNSDLGLVASDNV